MSPYQIGYEDGRKQDHSRRYPLEWNSGDIHDYWAGFKKGITEAEREQWEDDMLRDATNSSDLRYRMWSVNQN